MLVTAVALSHQTSIHLRAGLPAPSGADRDLVNFFIHLIRGLTDIPRYERLDRAPLGHFD